MVGVDIGCYGVKLGYEGVGEDEIVYGVGFLGLWDNGSVMSF